MTAQPQPGAEGVSWAERSNQVAAADGNEWDRLSDAFDADWKVAYAKAFVEFAVSRGWSRADAETWPPEIAADALIASSDVGYDPQRQAEADVPECEEHDG